MKYKFIKFLVFFVLLSSCGFELVTNNINYKIKEIKVNGDQRINFKLKNKLLFNQKNDNKNFVKLTINTKKIKSIKEKNIKNQITKYNIKINAEISYTILSENITEKFFLNKNGFFNVSSRHSETLNNEKNLVNLLINDLSEEIIDNLNIKLNDL